jgi:hypothetical protein
VDSIVGFGVSLESGGVFCVGAFGRNLASVAVKTRSHLFHKEILKIIYIATFHSICKGNAAINYITVERKNVHSRRLSRVVLQYLHV